MTREKHQPLGASLPHRNVDYQAPAPTLGANIAPAYLAQTSALEPSTLPRTPTDADLAATVDTSQTAAIRDLANKLDKDPVKIYEFVRNNIVYEPYYGSRKGAQGQVVLMPVPVLPHPNQRKAWLRSSTRRRAATTPTRQTC